MGTARPLTQTLGAPRSIQGIDFTTGTEVFFGLSNELVASIIPRDQLIAGVPCARGLVHFHPDGGLFQATLARAHETRGLAFSAGSTLTWSEDGTLGAWLVHEATLDGVTLPAGVHARFDEHGTLETWTRRAARGERIHGLRCAAGSVVTFYGSGGVQRATLSDAHTFDGDIVALGGADVELHRNGRVAVVTLADAITRGRITFEPGTLLVFRHDGTLSVAQLADPLTLGDVTYPDGTYLRFDDAEQLTSHAALTWQVQRLARS